MNTPEGGGARASDAQPPTEYTEALARHRDEIDAIDARLIELLAQRRDVVARVVALKKEHRQPVHQPAREEDVISRKRALAKRAGLDPDFVENMFRSMLRDSRVSQSRHMRGLGVRPGARVVIVGGRGAMGRCFHEWFAEAGCDVVDFGRQDWERAEERLRGADLVLLSVPINATEELARRIGPALPPQCVLADITSTKIRPMAAMLEAHVGPVLGLHPIFGPTTSSMDKQIVAVTPGRDEEACRWVIDQFVAWGAVTILTTPEEHDEAMAVVQALRHFATFAFGQFLQRRGLDLHRTLDFSSPIYRLELAMVGRLFAQDAGLYAEIIFATPERLALLKEYIASIEGNRAMLEAGDKEGFIREFRAIAEYFGPFSEQAIRESTFLIEKLIERF